MEKPASNRVAAWLLDTPLGWALLAFGVYFYRAQFIAIVGWNAVELIVAQHLLEHGAYVTSLDYPSALTWRPLVPTLLVAFLRLWTSNPILIYQIVCGTSLAALTGALFLAARMLWGRTAAHATAFFAVSCPAITLYLIDHTHSYSHLVALLVLGPALGCSLWLLRDPVAGKTRSGWCYALTGALWGLCYLCRGELVLFFGLHLGLLGWRQLRRRESLRGAGIYLATFLVFFLAYSFCADRIATREGLLARKTIYGMYASQGWADPPPEVGPDIEADGYVYAKKLYGDPLANGESVLTAVRHNPAAFFRRVQLNTRVFYAKYLDPRFFSPWWSLAVLAVGGLLVAGRIAPKDRWPVAFLFGLFLATHFVLMFHIDARYLSINIPPLLLLTGYAVHLLAGRLRRAPVAPAIAIAAGLLAGLLFISRDQLDRLVHHAARNDQSIAAMKSLGRHFHAVVPAPHLAKNLEPHIGLVFPAASSVRPEDQFLLSYFSHTAWVNHGADAEFPRGRLYSFRECADDYLYVPADRMTDPGARKDPRIIDEYDNPVLGHYYLLQLNP